MLDFSGYFYYVNQLELQAKFRSLTNLVVHLFTFCFAIEIRFFVFFIKSNSCTSDGENFERLFQPFPLIFLEFFLWNNMLLFILFHLNPLDCIKISSPELQNPNPKHDNWAAVFFCCPWAASWVAVLFIPSALLERKGERDISSSLQGVSSTLFFF